MWLWNSHGNRYIALPAFISSAFGAESGVKSLLPDTHAGNYVELEEATEAWKCALLNIAMQPSIKSVQALWDSPLHDKEVC